MTRSNTSFTAPGRYTQIYGTNGGSWNTYATLFGGLQGTGSYLSQIVVISRSSPSAWTIDQANSLPSARSDGSSVSFSSGVPFPLILRPSYYAFLIKLIDLTVSFNRVTSSRPMLGGKARPVTPMRFTSTTIPPAFLLVRL
jgi:hypothetical protein